MPTAVEVTELVEQWMPLAAGIARKWGARYPWLSDCFASAAAESLWRVAQKFGNDGDVRFAGVVRQAVRWALASRLRAERRHNPTAFMNQSTATDSDADELLDLVAGREPEPGAAIENAEAVAVIFERAELTERQRAVFVRCVGDDEEQTAIAAEQGVSRKRIGQIVNTAREKVRAVAEVV